MATRNSDGQGRRSIHCGNDSERFNTKYNRLFCHADRHQGIVVVVPIEAEGDGKVVGQAHCPCRHWRHEESDTNVHAAVLSFSLGQHDCRHLDIITQPRVHSTSHGPFHERSTVQVRNDTEAMCWTGLRCGGQHIARRVVHELDARLREIHAVDGHLRSNHGGRLRGEHGGRLAHDFGRRQDGGRNRRHGTEPTERRARCYMSWEVDAVERDLAATTRWTRCRHHLQHCRVRIVCEHEIGGSHFVRVVGDQVHDHVAGAANALRGHAACDRGRVLGAGRRQN